MNLDCQHIIHPFQEDPGVSQRERIRKNLVIDPPRIDGRNLADLLQYFLELAPHINYYDAELNSSNWLPFFRKSQPFILAGIARYDFAGTEKKLIRYNNLFDKKPSRQSLQLIVHLIYNSSIQRIFQWQKDLKDSELPVSATLENLIRNNLRESLGQFLELHNAAVRRYCIQRVNETGILGKWALANGKTITGKNWNKGRTKRDRITTMRNAFLNLNKAFLYSLQIIAESAEKSIGRSLLPLQEKLQKKHAPHIGLLFAFLKLFRYLQKDLNSITKKHLDYFYKEILKIKPREAASDQAHIVFEIQKQLNKYLLKKGLLVKDGKDENKVEIYFSLEDDIVVNKVQVADQRTLFLNHQSVYDHTYLQGLFIANDPTMADGVDKPFPDNQPKNYPTLGAAYSKYLIPEARLSKPYPRARIGFVLASPVLLLNEGKRTIDIKIDCELRKNLCAELEPVPANGKNPCCDEMIRPGIAGKLPAECGPAFISSRGFYEKVQETLQLQYYYINQLLILEALKNGIAESVADTLRKFLLVKLNGKLCYCPVDKYYFDRSVEAGEFENEFSGAELEVLKQWFSPRKLLKISFSGEKEWVVPDDDELIIDLVDNGAGQFTLQIHAVLKAEKPAVTYFDGEKLKEKIDTKLPLAKLILDDAIKIYLTDDQIKDIINNEDDDSDDCCPDNSECCVRKEDFPEEHEISLYHFFRNLIIPGGNANLTRIDVTVCGVKQLIVQNDESLQDVNSPVYPFGTRPDIIDFSIVSNSKIYCVNQEFIDDAVLMGITNATKGFLDFLIVANPNYKIGNSEEDVNQFLLAPPFNVNPALNDVINLKSQFFGPKLYWDPNLVGPNFYIGSKEIFCKKWNEINVNLNWKDKPKDFNEYYMAYWAEPKMPVAGVIQKYGLYEDKFEINLSVLQEGIWKEEILHPNPPPPLGADDTLENHVTHFNNRKLFGKSTVSTLCNRNKYFEQLFHLKNTYFSQYASVFALNEIINKKYEVNNRTGFLKINLQNQDFLHKDYAYVLARQMMALGKYPTELLENAVYRDKGGSVIVFKNFGNLIKELEDSITNSINENIAAITITTQLYNLAAQATGYLPIPPPVPPAALPAPLPFNDPIDNAERELIFKKIYATLDEIITAKAKADEVGVKYGALKVIYSILDIFNNTVVKPLEVPIPNEPWTPIISKIELDYSASAIIDDINLIHLYPFKDTYKKEELKLAPSLFPLHCDEGSLFIGLKDQEPGANLNILFQMAEATADTEADKADLQWHYLSNNLWKPLRKGFEVIDDKTNGLTASGIVKFAMPADITNKDTIMPSDKEANLFWIKASAKENSRAICETIGIHTQAILSRFTNEITNDKLRLSKPLPAGSISKLQILDANIKKTEQPYDSFGGKEPEIERHYYTRVSELLRHKGRAIQKFDYERIILEEFIQVYRTKCINHNFALDARKYITDFPIAPGYITIAVIPDLTMVKAGNSFEPGLPSSVLEKIMEYVKKRSTPFARIRVMNPRYEMVNICLKVKLLKGKDETYFKEKLGQDIREFLAPWAVGKYSKLKFGQCINHSDLIAFLESRDYLDYILDLQWGHEADWNKGLSKVERSSPDICPKGPRSILVGGIIDICAVSEDCNNDNN